ncbi:unnamed protein product [Amoebophrya sp. A120]|nr:unnamed protein product [Amoebophrya sp. A120]|eukprot:GSA120T00024943001.1
MRSFFIHCFIALFGTQSVAYGTRVHVVTPTSEKSTPQEPNGAQGSGGVTDKSTPQENDGGSAPSGLGWGRSVGKLPGYAATTVGVMVLLGLLYSAAIWWLYVMKVEIVPKEKDRMNQENSARREHDPDLDADETTLIQPEEDVDDYKKMTDQMIMVASAIQDGAHAFMKAETLVMLPFLALAAILIGVGLRSGPTVLAFIMGSGTSIAAAYLGMMIASKANVRTCYQCWSSLHEGFDMALLSGSVMGFLLTSMGVGAFLITWLLLDVILSRSAASEPHADLAHALCGFGLGASLVALFARVGGGIYTKAADVGADLSGKNEYGMDEDDPRNPACIADNVGDNVGDIAGMGADLFGSFAESSAAACYIWYKFATNVSGAAENTLFVGDVSASLYPLLVSASGILAGLLTIGVNFLLPKVTKFEMVEPRLKWLLLIATGFEVVFVFVVGHTALPAQFLIRKQGSEPVPTTDLQISGCVIIGLISGFLIGLITEYYTSHSYHPVRETAAAYQQSASTGLILGTALGMKSTAVPVLLIAGTIVGSLLMAGPFGIAMAGLGMLSTLSIGLTIDAYGPIADNAGGIAEMSGLGNHVRQRTDCLDAAGNTTAAIGKGFAVGSAALVGMALFFAFLLAAHEGDTKDFRLEVLNQFVLLGLFLGSMLPFIFGALLMTSVAHAAQEMLAECLEQFPKIVNEGAAPDYERCITISTRASLKEMIVPALMVVFSPLIGGLMFGTNFTCGLLMGVLLTALLLAVSMSNSGGAYDNAKKYIEAGGIGPGRMKGSQTHKNAVVGDTLGDPLKDTSGPALNIFMKLSAVTALTFAPFLKQYSPEGNPGWMPKNK